MTEPQDESCRQDVHWMSLKARKAPIPKVKYLTPDGKYRICARCRLLYDRMWATWEKGDARKCTSLEQS